MSRPRAKLNQVLDAMVQQVKDHYATRREQWFTSVPTIERGFQSDRWSRAHPSIFIGLSSSRTAPKLKTDNNYKEERAPVVVQIIVEEADNAEELIVEVVDDLREAIDSDLQLGDVLGGISTKHGILVDRGVEYYAEKPEGSEGKVSAVVFFDVSYTYTSRSA